MLLREPDFEEQESDKREFFEHEFNIPCASFSLGHLQMGLGNGEIRGLKVMKSVAAER